MLTLYGLPNDTRCLFRHLNLPFYCMTTTQVSVSMWTGAVHVCMANHVWDVLASSRWFTWSWVLSTRSMSMCWLFFFHTRHLYLDNWIKPLISTVDVSQIMVQVTLQVTLHTYIWSILMFDWPFNNYMGNVATQRDLHPVEICRLNGTYKIRWDESYIYMFECSTCISKLGKGLAVNTAKNRGDLRSPFSLFVVAGALAFASGRWIISDNS